MDVYSAHASVPGHLVTAEFWRSLPRALNTDGVVMVNLIFDRKLQSTYARNVLATIEASLGRCSVEVLDRSVPASNVAVFCRAAAARESVATIYTDERNRVDLDRSLYGF